MSSRVLDAFGTGGSLLVKMDFDPPYAAELSHVHIEYVAAASPTGPRYIRIAVEDENGIASCVTSGLTPHMSSFKRQYNLQPNVPQTTASPDGTVNWCPWPEHFLLRSGDRLRVYNQTDFAVPNDTIHLRAQYERVKLTDEEFPFFVYLEGDARECISAENGKCFELERTQ